MDAFPDIHPDAFTHPADRAALSGRIYCYRADTRNRIVFPENIAADHFSIGLSDDYINVIAIDCMRKHACWNLRIREVG